MAEDLDPHVSTAYPSVDEHGFMQDILTSQG